MSDDLLKHLEGPPEGAGQHLREAYYMVGHYMKDAKIEIERLRDVLTAQSKVHRDHVKGLNEQHRAEREVIMTAAEGFKKKAEALEAVLDECDEYFDNRADVAADCTEGTTPNQEMRLLTAIREARKV